MDPLSGDESITDAVTTTTTTITDGSGSSSNTQKRFNKLDRVGVALINDDDEVQEYKDAQVIMWYIDCRSETRTKPHLIKEVEKGEKKIIVPYCTEDENGENKSPLNRAIHEISA